MSSFRYTKCINRFLSVATFSAGILLISGCNTEEPYSEHDTTPVIESSPKGTSAVLTLSEQYPADQGMADDPAVLFYDNFEQGLGRWDEPKNDTKYLHLETKTGLAHGGTTCLRSTVTKADLDTQEYISSCPRFTFGQRAETIYWRFYARVPGRVTIRVPQPSGCVLETARNGKKVSVRKKMDNDKCKQYREKMKTLQHTA